MRIFIKTKPTFLLLQNVLFYNRLIFLSDISFISAVLLAISPVLRKHEYYLLKYDKG